MRVAGYIRVSSEGQAEEGWSLDAQERAITHHAQAHGWEIVAWYREEGRSARSEKLDKRPAFAQMVADAEAGRFDSIVVHKLDRFSRNLLVTIDTLGRLERAGVGFASVTESIDLATPIGKLMLSLLASLAAFYSDNLSAETRKGKQERKRQGWWNGLLPFGVTTNQTGFPVLDERPWACNVATRAELTPADGLRLAFRLATEGHTDRQVARALNAAGYLTSGNRGANRFTKDSVRAILTNRFYLGELPDGDNSLPGRHGVLIDTALFSQAHAHRERIGGRRMTGIGTKRQPWALSGIATCAYCGRSLTASGNGSGRRRIQCQGRAQGLGCAAMTFYADRLDEQIAATLEAFTVPSPMRADFVRQAVERASKDRSGTAATRKRLEGQLVRLRELYLDGDLAKVEYTTRRAALQHNLGALPVPVEMGQTEAELLATYLADVGSAWRAATDVEKNRIARSLFSEVLVANGTAVGCLPRPDLSPFFRQLEARSPELVTYLRKRRGTDARRRYGEGYIGVAKASPVERVGHSGRAKLAKPRAWIDDLTRDRIEELAGLGWSLRTIAAEVGVSHESVRTVLGGTMTERVEAR